MNPPSPFLSDVSARLWDAKYRLREAGEQSIHESWRRVAKALASVEPAHQDLWETRFHGILADFRFLPGGRILAGAGNPRKVTLFNCFVMGVIEDSLDGIFDGLKEGALTMQQGGGVGYDFSTLRPFGMQARGAGAIASGPVSFMGIWDAMCATILSTGARRGAMMATLRCDHPDIEAFIDAKRHGEALRHFNLSVLVSDAFMAALQADGDWPLVFPLGSEPAAPDEEIAVRAWGGHPPEPCRVLRRVPARALWERIMGATYEAAEPGVIFIDRVRRANNLWYAEKLISTNPCGEVPLPAYGACDLGSVNLPRFVEAPFTPEARLDLQAIAATVEVATRMLDNVYDLSRFPLPRQREAAQASRRLGLGVTGLADALIMLGLRYDSEAARAAADTVMKTVCHSAYRASIQLAKEKGPFPQFVASEHTQGEFIARLPEDIVDGIWHRGIRNSHLTAIAPTGTVSLLADNVSSGLEPVFRFEYQRRMHRADGALETLPVMDYAYRLFQQRTPGDALPAAFVTVADVSPHAQLAMQAVLQRHVDNAVSKTVTVPADYPFEDFVSLYREAYRLDLKGCTTFRSNPVTGAVLMEEPTPPESHCCSLAREAD